MCKKTKKTSYFTKKQDLNISAFKYSNLKSLKRSLIKSHKENTNTQ